MSVTVSEDEIAEWVRLEERFEKLVKLGTDERTPSGERDNACRAACQMIAEKSIDGWHAARAKKLNDAFSNLKTQFSRIHFRY